MDAGDAKTHKLKPPSSQQLIWFLPPKGFSCFRSIPSLLSHSVDVSSQLGSYFSLLVLKAWSSQSNLGFLCVPLTSSARQDCSS